MQLLLMMSCFTIKIAHVATKPIFALQCLNILKHVGFYVDTCSNLNNDKTHECTICGKRLFPRPHHHLFHKKSIVKYYSNPNPNSNPNSYPKKNLTVIRYQCRLLSANATLCC